MQQVVDQVNHSQEQSELTVTAFETMGDSVGITIGCTKDISNFNKQQQEQLIFLQDSFEKLFQVLQDNNVKADTTNMVATELSVAADRLQSILENFSTNCQEPAVKNADEKRNSPRINNSILVLIKNEALPIEAVTSDISMTGLNLRCRQSLQLGQLFSAELVLPHPGKDGDGKKLQTEIRIVRESKKGSDFLYGVEYVDLTDEQKQDLKKVFDFYLKPHQFA